MNTRDIVRALEKVPEKKLRLLELARECAGPDGRIDLERCAPLMAEVEQAMQEAEAYMRGTEALRCALARLMDR